MNKVAKGSIGLGMAASIIVAGLTTATNVFAEPMQSQDYKVVTNLKVSKNWLGVKTGITGTVNLDKTINSKPLEKVDSSANLYKGSLNSSVEAADLFEDAYKLYEQDYKGKKDFLGRYWENIVMFNEAKKFPTAQYTVKFPSNFKVNKDAIKATENTVTVSSIETKYNESDNSVTVILKLGNWNDYKGFFALVAKERNQSGHKINVDIPYTVDASSTTSTELGKITGSGNCYLYKCSGTGQGRIVNITTNNSTIVVSK